MTSFHYPNTIVDPNDTTPVPKASGMVVWQMADVLIRPEAVYYDDGSRFVYVANAGAPGGREGGGCLSRLSPDGTVTAARWVQGLDAPKGMRSFRNTLYVNCTNYLAVIDVAKAEVVGRVLLPGAAGPTGLAVDAAGTVYTADRLTGRIYSYDGRVASVFAEGEDLESPNGLLVIGNQLFVAGWGQDGVGPGAGAPGRLFALNLKTRQKTLVTPYPVGNLGGLERDERCNFLVADWVAGKMYLVAPKGEVTQLLAGVPGAGGHGFVPDRRWLLVPRPNENSVTAYDLMKIKK
jgi:sugar lactone lactonase YvrE